LLMTSQCHFLFSLSEEIDFLFVRKYEEQERKNNNKMLADIPTQTTHLNLESKYRKIYLKL